MSLRSKNILLFSIALLVGCIAFLYHEMWRDEHQAYMIIKCSDSPFDLFENKRFEAHPYLYYLIFYFLSFKSLFYFKLLHLLVSVIIIFLLIFKSPFSLFQKILVVFNYFILYEYFVFSRNYALGFCFLLFFAYYYKSKNVYRPLFFLFLASQTSFVALLVSIACFFAYFYANYKQKKFTIKTTLVWIVSFSFVCILNYFDYRLPDESDVVQQIPFSLQNILVGFSHLSDAFLLILPNQIHFWGQTLFSNNYLRLLFSVVILSFLLFTLKKSKSAQILFLLSCLLLTGLFSFKHPGAIRHHGFFLVAYIISYWIKSFEQFESLTQNSLLNHPTPLSISRYWMCIYIFFFIINSRNIAIATFYDFKYPFSGASNLSDYIKKKLATNVNLFGMTDALLVPVIAESNLHVTSLNTNLSACFVKWNIQRKVLDNEKLNESFQYFITNKSPIYFISTNQDSSIRLPYKSTLLFQNKKCIEASEEYKLYKIEQ